MEVKGDMKIVFLQDVPRVGKKGEIKDVANGYGSNYLVPKKLALLATPAAINLADAQLQKETKQKQQMATQLSDLAQQLEGTTITIKAKVIDEERLYGSIRETDIADELSSLAGFDVDKSCVDLDEPIRQLGSYEVTIRLAKNLASKITITVTKEE